MIQTQAANQALPTQVAAAAAAAGLQVLSAQPSSSFDGTPTTRFALTLADDPSRSSQLELSQSFDAGHPDFQSQLALFLTETARRLRNPRPNTLLTLGGIPLSFDHFEWPFHASTAGADTSLVHGQINLEDGTPSLLHAKIAASMTVTFREVVRAPEQPFAESFILNAVRKTLDQGQLELVKSGNRQPVPVTTRFYSGKQKKFIFNDTTEPQRRAFLAAKTFWLSGILGHGSPVWLLDPRDAQYLNASLPDLQISLDALVQQGLVHLDSDPGYASPTETLMQRKPHYEADLAQALVFIKPSFNEDMRGGHTNM